MTAERTKRRSSLAAIRRSESRYLGQWDGAMGHLPVQRNLPFTADSLCPLAHTESWHELNDSQRLRYNQLVGLFQNEMIVFFETALAATVLPVLINDKALPSELRVVLTEFLEDEKQHTKGFRALNRDSVPEWYSVSDAHVLQVPDAFLRVIRHMAERPAMFPCLFWLMLIMEERSLMISRELRGLHLEPRWAAVYEAHLRDEVRHVQADWHLLERFWMGRSWWVRRGNALLLRVIVLGAFLKPRRANVRLIDLLIKEFPELHPRRARLIADVRNLLNCPGYRRMMYSEVSTPITRQLFMSLPELRGLWERMAG